MLRWDVIGDAERDVLADPPRLRSVRRIVGGPVPDEAFDRLAMLVRMLVDAPMGVVCLVDEEKQHFAGQVGLPDQLAAVREMPLTRSFSRHVVVSGELLAIADVRTDPRMRDNPAIEEVGAIAYVGAPIRDADGLVVGALCAVDQEPRIWTASEVALLSELAAVCSSEVCLRIARTAAEESRLAAEAARATAEEERAAAESARTSAEESRLAAEAARATAEEERAAAEEARTSAEESRLAAEAARATAEEERAAAERARNEAEEARAAAEWARRESESAHHQLELLAELTEALAATMDVDEAMRRLGGIVTARIADWCVVTVAEDPGHGALVSATHREAERDTDMVRLSELMAGSRADLRTMLSAVRRDGRVVRTSDLRSQITDAELGAITARAGLGSTLVVPITSPVRLTTLGAVLLVNGPERGPFTAVEERTALEIGRRAGLAVENSRLYREQRHMAEVLQRSLLTELPDIPGVELHARYLPAQDGAAVGGDWYDAFAQPDGSVVVAVGDVSGHDIEAAATMGQLRNLVRGDAYGRDEEPGALLSALDQALHGLAVPASATAVLARIRASWSGYAVSFANAGHPPPLLLLPNGEVQVWWVPPEPLLGLPPREPRTTAKRFVPAGSTLVLYTDGLVEDREQLLDDGVARVSEVLREFADRPGDELCERLLEVARGRSDDIALLLVKLA
ncbi:SpoIIE family protein phosphatase [Actinoplanes sp. NPDC051861]|uniref:SpoIIE family protein phosphatase n=1 Tax=Actinoplanes sp. NPDC051861 TaxID=3155170 RepID=UPI003419BC01